MRAAVVDGRFSLPVLNHAHGGARAGVNSGSATLPGGAPVPAGVARELQSPSPQWGPYWRLGSPIQGVFSLSAWIYASRAGTISVRMEQTNVGFESVPVEAGVWTLYTRTGIRWEGPAIGTFVAYRRDDLGQSGDITAMCGLTVTPTPWPVVPSADPYVWPIPV